MFCIINRIILPDTVSCRIKVLFPEIQQQINKRRKLIYIQVKFNVFIFAEMQLTWFLYNSKRVNYGGNIMYSYGHMINLFQKL
jgi:hypothetical protein